MSEVLPMLVVAILAYIVGFLWGSWLGLVFYVAGFLIGALLLKKAGWHE